MHKSGYTTIISCVKTGGFLHIEISQQISWGNIARFCARFTNLFQSFYTRLFRVSSLFLSVYTRFAQELLLELHINKLVKG